MLVWNRQRFIKDPNTGKRVSRPNPEAKWIRTEVPELRVVDDELWQRVRLRQAELAKQFGATTVGVRAARAKRLNSLRRPAFLLSGLLICGCCGGRYGTVVNDRYGCLGHFRKGICDNGRTVRRGDIERRVLAGLTDTLVSPEAVAVAVRAYAEETNRQNHERRAQAEADRRTLEKIERGLKGIMVAIEDGMYQPAMKARMGELARQKAEIEARLAEAPADASDVHPNVAELYRAKITRLAETLADPESNGEARDDIRSLVGEVVLTPGEKRGQIHALLRGELMAILDLAEGRRRSPRPEVITTALASPGNHHKSSREVQSSWGFSCSADLAIVADADSDEAGRALNEPAPSEQQEVRCGETCRLRGFVTLACREREVSVPQELSGRRDRRPPRGHRDTAKHAVRLG